MKEGEIRICFPTVASYSCNLSETKVTSKAGHGAGRRKPCARCYSTYEDRVTGRKTSSCVAAETTDTRRKLGEKQAEAASLCGRDRSTRRPKIQSEVVALLHEQFPAKWPSFLEDICGGDEIVTEYLYFTSTFEPLHNFHLEVPRLLKLCFVQNFSFNGTCSRLRFSPEKRKKVELGETAPIESVQCYTVSH